MDHLGTSSSAGWRGLCTHANTVSVSVLLCELQCYVLCRPANLETIVYYKAACQWDFLTMLFIFIFNFYEFRALSYFGFCLWVHMPNPCIRLGSISTVRVICASCGQCMIVPWMSSLLEESCVLCELWEAASWRITTGLSWPHLSDDWSKFVSIIGHIPWRVFGPVWLLHWHWCWSIFDAAHWGGIHWTGGGENRILLEGIIITRAAIVSLSCCSNSR